MKVTLDEVSPILDKLQTTLIGEDINLSIAACIILLYQLNNPNVNADQLYEAVTETSKFVRALSTKHILDTHIPLPKEKIN